MRRTIGITSDSGKAEKPAHRKHSYYWMKQDLPDAVLQAGGMPFMLPISASKSWADDVIKKLDGLIISGGYFDIDPALYGSQIKKMSKVEKQDRTSCELLLLKAALKKGIPILGICGGQQLINIYFGGTLHQDINSELPKAGEHEQKTDFRKCWHNIKIEKNSLLAKAVGGSRLGVNSTHHQSVHKIGKGLITTGVATDGVIEAVEKPEHKFLLAVQWHPELLIKNSRQLNIFTQFVKAAK